jgi:hypothetical protein
MQLRYRSFAIGVSGSTRMSPGCKDPRTRGSTLELSPSRGRLGFGGKCVDRPDHWVSVSSMELLCHGYNELAHVKCGVITQLPYNSFAFNQSAKLQASRMEIHYHESLKCIRHGIYVRYPLKPRMHRRPRDNVLHVISKHISKLIHGAEESLHPV